MEKHMIKLENGENSYIKITGEVGQELCYSHTSFGERFYEVPVEVKRFSGNIDKVPVILPERFCSQLKAGSHVGIRGQLRTHSKDVGNHRQLLLRIFAREVWEAQDCGEDINQVELNGFLCKEPIYRRTPLKREITDLMVAVNRSHGKSDYIPCICWGKDAHEANRKKVGEPIHILGRMQSRKYVKRFPEGYQEEMVTYEISVMKILDACEKMKLGEER